MTFNYSLYFSTDTYAEIELIRNAAITAGATDAVICSHWADGGPGALNLADAVMKACEEPSKFKLLYDLDESIEHKIEIIAREMYGAGKIEYLPKVKEILEQCKKQVRIL